MQSIRIYFVIIISLFLIILQYKAIYSQTIDVAFSGRVIAEFTMPSSNFNNYGANIFTDDVNSNPSDSTLTISLNINTTRIMDTLSVFVGLFTADWNSIINDSNFVLTYDKNVFSYFNFMFDSSYTLSTKGIVISSTLKNKIPEGSINIKLLKQYFILPNALMFYVNTNIPRGSAAWFPLKKNNLWEYKEYVPEEKIYSTFQYLVIDSLNINGRAYYIIKKDRLFNNGWANISIDTVNINKDNDIISKDSRLYWQYYSDWQSDQILYEKQFDKVIYKTTFSDLMPGTSTDGSAVPNIGILDYSTELIGFPPDIDIHLNGAKINNKLVYGVISGISEVSNKIPLQFSLEQNFPNPFNPTTKINYSISKPCNIILAIYDIIGRKVAVLVDEEESAGYYQVNFNAANLSSGIYFYQIKANGYTQTKKMLLLK